MGRTASEQGLTWQPGHPRRGGGSLEEEGILLFILFSSRTGAGDGVRSGLCLQLSGLHTSLRVQDFTHHLKKKRKRCEFVRE